MQKEAEISSEQNGHSEIALGRQLQFLRPWLW